MHGDRLIGGRRRERLAGKTSHRMKAGIHAVYGSSQTDFFLNDCQTLFLTHGLQTFANLTVRPLVK